MSKKTLGKAIMEIRKAKGLSQANVESKTGIKREYLSKIETGDLSNQTLKTVAKIAEALGIKASELIAETESNNSASNIKLLHLTLDKLNQIKRTSEAKGRKAERKRLKELI